MTRGRFSRGGVVALAALLAGGGFAAADTAVTGVRVAPEPENNAAARAIALQSEGLDMVNRAARRVEAKRPSCRPRFPSSRVKVTHDVPATETLNAIAALRRPARPDELALAGSSYVGFPGGETYVDYVRSVTAANGDRLVVMIDRGTFGVAPPSTSCLDAEHTELVRLLRGKAPRLRSAALRASADVRRSWEAAPPDSQMPHDRIFVEGFGGGDLTSFVERGEFGSAGNDRSSTLSGIVPDGVASITLDYPRVVSLGPLYKPLVYPSALRRTVRVQQNALSVHVPRGAGEAIPPRMVWRDATGKVLRVVKSPNLGLPTG